MISLNIEDKREKEKKIVEKMIGLYCKKNHSNKKELCQECEDLRDYAFIRSDKCPFMETKNFCSNCEVHCYSPEMREKIRIVMRFSGPRLFLTNPIAASQHLISSAKEKRRIRQNQSI